MTLSQLTMVLLVAAAHLQWIAAQCLTEGDAAPPITDKAHHQLLDGQFHFSTDLIKTVTEAQPGENVFFSPSSVFNALLLAYLVSANRTEVSLRDTLHLQDQKKVDTVGAYSLEKYCRKLRAINASLSYQLRTANRIYVSNKEKIRPCVKKYFRDDIEAADFTKNVTDTTMKINNWVSGQTRGNIKDLLSPDSLNANTNLVLVSAAYFKGFWEHRFSPENTKEMKFTLANGTNIPVQMMSLESGFNHNSIDELEADLLELPYEGDEISMYLLLPMNPSPTAIAELINKTDAETLKMITNSSSSNVGDVSVLIPKFSMDESLQLTQVLEAMGIGDLFQTTADLSRVTGSPGLRLDSVLHKAKITVDEMGSEAAAATAIFANRFAADTFVADHPFVYFIYDKKENIVLFFGVFNTPEK